MKINDKVIKQIGTMFSDLFCWNTYYVDLLFALSGVCNAVEIHVKDANLLISCFGVVIP